VDLDQYQAEASKTDGVPLPKGSDQKLHFLLHGLVDEVGQIASLLKKCMRQDIEIGDQTPEFISRLGDTLWYLAALSGHFDVRLSAVAEKNLAFLRERWTKQPPHLFSSQREFLSQPHERFPDREEFTFERREEGGIVKMRLVTRDGVQIGDVVDDNEYQEDFYRFHDVIHIGLMAHFRWSPVFRKLLNLKRKSDATTDRVEDGAKARDIEEAMSRLIFLYFEHNRFLEGATSVDTLFLKQLRLFSGEREIGWVTGKEWQDMMLQTAAAIRGMIAASREGTRSPMSA
jgi:NTP pyrophosphatase (non-canonical NTP hydrolase)